MKRIDRNLIKKLIPIVGGLRKYHRHGVLGLDAIPDRGKVLVVCTHSLATYEIALLMHAIYEATGRVARPLIDRLFYKIPYLGELLTATGGIEGSRNSARALLSSNEIVMVAPGGMKEALRPSTERYQIRWDQRQGFAQIAIETGTSVVLAVCPKADDMYEVYPNRVTKWAYQAFKIPVFLARGVGYTPIPRPVQLTHFLSELIVPPEPAASPAALRRQVALFHKQLISRAHELIADAVRYRPGHLGTTTKI